MEARHLTEGGTNLKIEVARWRQSGSAVNQTNTRLISDEPHCMSTLFCYSNDYCVEAVSTGSVRNRTRDRNVLMILSPVFSFELELSKVLSSWRMVVRLSGRDKKTKSFESCEQDAREPPIRMSALQTNRRALVRL